MPVPNYKINQKQPTQFLREAWPKILLWDKLNEIAESVVNNKRTVVPSGHSIGKTFIASRLALWFLFNFYPAKVITTAPTWRQVEKLLWSEIAKGYNTSKFMLGGRLLQTELKLEEDWFAIGLSTNAPAADREFGATGFQGFHSENLLVILDEGPGVLHEIWVSVESLVTSPNNKILAIGNPSSPVGDFYDACKSPLWNKIKVSCFDHPNVKEGKIIIPGAVTKDWVEERRQEWGEQSPLWFAKVLGEFPPEGVDTLIPLVWAEACVGLDLPEEGGHKLGVDVARYGDDYTVLAEIVGKTLMPLEAVNKKDTNWTIGRITVLNKRRLFDAVSVDDTGVGGGVTDGLEEAGVEVVPVNNGERAIDTDTFENRGTEIYWNLREAIRQKELSLPDDKELLNQLCSRRFKYTRKGKIILESKDEYKKRTGGKSPDKADAVALALSAGNFEDSPVITIVSSGGDDDDL